MPAPAARPTLPCFEQLFEQLRHDEKAMGPLQRSRLVIHLAYRDPSGELLVDARRTPAAITFGPASVPRMALEIELQAQTLHRILLGELSLSKAMGDKLLLVRGPVMKALALAELFRQGQAIYPEVLRRCQPGTILDKPGFSQKPGL